MQKRISQYALDWFPAFLLVPAERSSCEVLAAYLLAFNAAWNSHNGVPLTAAADASMDAIWQDILEDEPNILSELRYPDRRELANAIIKHKQRHAPLDDRIIVRAGVLPGDDGEVRVVADFVNKKDYRPGMIVSPFRA